MCFLVNLFIRCLKRQRDEKSIPKKHDDSLLRDHFGVNFDSSKAEVIDVITDFLNEQRSDLVGK